jgi:hypothetical protein
MYAEIAITALAVASITVAKLLKDILMMRLIGGTGQRQRPQPGTAIRNLHTPGSGAGNAQRRLATGTSPPVGAYPSAREPPARQSLQTPEVNPAAAM